MTYTNATALAAAIEIVRENSTDHTLIEKLCKMHETATKPRAKGEKKPSKTRIENEGLAAKLPAAVEGLKTFERADVAAAMSLAPGKAGAVIKVARDLGIVEVVPGDPEKAIKTLTYRLA